VTDVDLDAERLVALLARRPLVSEASIEADWERLLALAMQHDVAAVLRARLKERGLIPPPAIAEALRQVYFASAARNMRLFHELGGILRALQAAGIPVIPLKGACLAEAVYGDIALRPMSDLDLWVQRQQLDAARAVMQSLGYVSRSKADRPLALQDALAGETQMFKANAPLVEIHWNIFPGEWVRHTTRIDEDVVWHRTVPLEGEGVRQLSPEDAVIQSCVHLAVSHQMSGIGLRTLLDLDLARQQWVIDWRAVGQRARAWRVSCATWLVLQALAGVFGDPGNQLPLGGLSPSPFRRFVLKRFASTRLLMEGLDLSSGPRRFLFLLSIVDRPADAVVLLWRALFPDRLWLTLRYDLPGATSWRVWRLRLRHIAHLVISREI
jgi:hypothetical protein